MLSGKTHTCRVKGIFRKKRTGSPHKTVQAEPDSDKVDPRGMEKEIQKKGSFLQNWINRWKEEGGWEREKSSSNLVGNDSWPRESRERN